MRKGRSWSAGKKTRWQGAARRVRAMRTELQVVVVHPGLHGIQIVPGHLYTVSDIVELFGAIRRGLTAWYEQKETA
jgi:hypothetical protein